MIQNNELVFLHIIFSSSHSNIENQLDAMVTEQPSPVSEKKILFYGVKISKIGVTARYYFLTGLAT